MIEALAGASIFTIGILGFVLKGSFFSNLIGGGNIGSLFQAGSFRSCTPWWPLKSERNFQESSLDFTRTVKSMLNLFLLSSTALVLIGLFGVLTRKNIVKILLCLNILETGINLLLVAFGFREGGIAPILTSPESVKNLALMVDPVPQALVLTAIVIGLGTTTFALGLTIRYFITHGSVSIAASESEEVVSR